MAKPKLDRRRAARVVVDAIALGSDEAAAQQHGCSVKSVKRYRSRVHEDPELARLVQKLAEKAEVGWHAARTRFLCEIVDQLRDGIKKTLEEGKGVMTADMVRAVSEAAERVGKLDVAARALNVSSGDDSGDSRLAEDASHDGEGASASEELPH